MLAAQIGIAVGANPSILNATTKVAASWFPLEERAAAAGLGSLAIYVGASALGLALTPILAAGLEIRQVLLVYGIAAVIAAVAFFSWCATVRPRLLPPQSQRNAPWPS